MFKSKYPSLIEMKKQSTKEGVTLKVIVDRNEKKYKDDPNFINMKEAFKAFYKNH